jgi:hypothetical protein
MSHLFEPIRTFEVNTKTDRDVEIPLVIEFVQKHKPQSVLDVGAHSSYCYYARAIRPLVERYVGVDIIKCPDTIGLLDDYLIGNANEMELPEVETVLCISTLEHAAISTYEGDHEKEMLKLFKTCLRYATKNVLVTFPVGPPYTYPGELSIVTKDQVRRFRMMCKGMEVRERFFLSQGPQASHPWQEHTNRDLAFSIPYVSTWGNQSICAMEIIK